MSAAFQPSAVKGSTTAVMMCSARKARVVSARLRWKPVVRKRGQAGVCHRMLETMPSTTTPLRRMSVTTPAPRVAYQRMVSLMPHQSPSPLWGRVRVGGDLIGIGPRSDVVDGSVVLHQPRQPAMDRQPVDGGLALHDGGGRRDVRVDRGSRPPPDRTPPPPGGEGGRGGAGVMHDGGPARAA